MRVLINGLPLFAKRLARQLKKYDSNSSFIFLDTYNSKWAQIKFFLLIPFSDCVISMNGVSDNSGSLNLVLKWKKKLVLQWMGTDALLAMERFANKTIERKYIDYGYNFVDSEWLMDELKSIQLEPEYLHFKSVETTPNIQTYEKISVVSYVAENRQEFYGMNRIAEIASKFPEIEFHLYGLNHSDTPTTENVLFHGWVQAEEFINVLRKTPVFLRLTNHDGFSVSVIEALGCGCEVIMSLPFELTHIARNSEEAIGHMNKVIQKIKDRGMKPNIEMIEIVKLRYNRDTLSKNYIEKLKQVVSK
jgi:glycosyltransferase involved in cell wall biosynthesis